MLEKQGIMRDSSRIGNLRTLRSRRSQNLGRSVGRSIAPIARQTQRTRSEEDTLPEDGHVAVVVGRPEIRSSPRFNRFNLSALCLRQYDTESKK